MTLSRDTCKYLCEHTPICWEWNTSLPRTGWFHLYVKHAPLAPGATRAECTAQHADSRGSLKPSSVKTSLGLEQGEKGVAAEAAKVWAGRAITQTRRSAAKLPQLISNNKTFAGGGFGFPLNTFIQKSYFLVEYWTSPPASVLCLEQETWPNNLITWKSLIAFMAESTSRSKQQFGLKNHSHEYTAHVFPLFLCSLLRDLSIIVYPEATSNYNLQLICVGFFQ